MLLRCKWFKRDCRRCKKVKKNGKSVIGRLIDRVWKVPKLLRLGEVREVKLKFDVDVKKSESVVDQEKLAKQNELYKVFMKNPKLHQPCLDIDINNLVLKSYPKKSAMHCASYLWNWNFKEKAARSISLLKCTQKILSLTIRNMNDRDLEIIKTLITDNCLTHLPSIEHSDSSEKVKYLLISEICNNPNVVNVLVEVIRKWYTVLPILEELSTCTSWDYICATKACLLDVDTLYIILLNIVYKTPQPNTL